MPVEPDAAAARQEHDILVEMIARRIGIATWSVATNTEASRSAAVPCPTAASGEAFPDIVSREKFTHRLAAVGEVETATTLGPERAEVWKTSSQLAPRFFLYVPEECEAAARALLASRRLRPTGLFLFRHTQNNTFVVKRAR